MKPECWFAKLPNAGPCEGPPRICHLIKQQVITRTVTSAQYWNGEPPDGRADVEWLTDPRCWVLGCGGLDYGNAGHHGQYKPDGPRLIPRRLLPPELEQYAEELGLGWYLDRTYGPVEAAA